MQDFEELARSCWRLPVSSFQERSVATLSRRSSDCGRRYPPCKPPLCGPDARNCEVCLRTDVVRQVRKVPKGDIARQFEMKEPPTEAALL